jgi:putative membrane protein
MKVSGHSGCRREAAAQGLVTISMIDDTIEQAEYRGEALAVRGVLGGLLMGLANLVPGISGGTMLLATGVYPHFIRGIAEISTFTFRAKTLLTLACIVGAALAAVLLFAGLVGGLVVSHRWIMYSLFIGLTLGGVPILWRVVKPADALVVGAAVGGIAVMAAIAFLGPSGSGTAADGSHAYGMYFVAGLAGASAMVLPGISGGYLLLILGQYITLLTAVAAVKDGLRGGDLPMILDAMHVIVPLGSGVVIGVVGVSNLIKVLLERFARPTLGVLLGLLLGAVIGLWPFQHGVPPGEGTTFRGDRVVVDDGRLMMERTRRPIEARDYDTATFVPTARQVGVSLLFIALGFVVATMVAHLGAGRPERMTSGAPSRT